MHVYNCIFLLNIMHVSLYTMYACYFDGSEFNDKNINYTTTLPFLYESCNIYTHEWIHATEKKETKTN